MEIVWIVLFILMFQMKNIKRAISIAQMKAVIRRYSRSADDRDVIVMTHAQTGMFGSMITMSDALKIEKLIREGNGRPTDLVVNTFGGDLFASMRIARVLRDNPNVRVVVPKYAWSGGTMIAMGAKEIVATPKSIFGPVDPQFGSFLKSFSAKEWQQIVKSKGKGKVNDDTVAMAMKGKQLMKEMRSYIDDITKGKKLDRKRLMKTLLEGDKTHGYNVSPQELKEIGFNVKMAKGNIYDYIIESIPDFSGVFAVKGRQKKK